MSPRALTDRDDEASARRRRPRRGLIIALVLTGGAGMAYLACRSLAAGIERYTDVAPVPLPGVSLPPRDQKNLFGRLAAFRTAIEARRVASPLTLTADEVNALVAVTPALGGRIWAEIEGDEVRARFSLPLEDLGFLQMHGRFLNGTSVLDLSIVESELIVSPRAIKVRTRELPEAVMARLRKANLARLGFRDGRVAKSLRKLSSVEVRGGIVEIKSR